MDRFRVSLLLLALFGCGPSIEDHFVQLGKGGEESEGAKHELLISGEQAIPDLLSALEDPRFAAGRHEMVDVLTTLMLRTEAPETIGMALERHLLHDPDTRVRSRIAQLLGLYKREEFAAAFLQAVDDTSVVVRYHAMSGLPGVAHSRSPGVRHTGARAPSRRSSDCAPSRCWHAR